MLVGDERHVEFARRCATVELAQVLPLVLARRLPRKHRGQALWRCRGAGGPWRRSVDGHGDFGRAPFRSGLTLGSQFGHIRRRSSSSLCNSTDLPNARLRLSPFGQIAVLVVQLLDSLLVLLAPSRSSRSRSSAPAPPCRRARWRRRRSGRRESCSRCTCRLLRDCPRILMIISPAPGVKFPPRRAGRYPPDGNVVFASADSPPCNVGRTWLPEADHLPTVSNCEPGRPRWTRRALLASQRYSPT